MNCYAKKSTYTRKYISIDGMERKDKSEDGMNEELAG